MGRTSAASRYGYKQTLPDTPCAADRAVLYPLSPKKMMAYGAKEAAWWREWSDFSPTLTPDTVLTARGNRAAPRHSGSARGDGLEIMSATELPVITSHRHASSSSPSPRSHLDRQLRDCLSRSDAAFDVRLMCV